MHALVNGIAKFVTPRIVKRGADKKEVIINSFDGGAALALGLSYMMECAAYSSDTDNRYENKTGRKNAAAVTNSLKDGDMADVFTLHMPAGIDESGNFTDKWTPILSMTRAEIVKTAGTIAAVDSILSKAEAACLAKVREAGKPDVKNIADVPTYGTAKSAGRAKRAGGVLKV